MANRLVLTIIVSIILTAIIISLVNIGTSLYLSSPEYNDYCGSITAPTMGQELITTKELCKSINGTWVTQEAKCLDDVCPNGYCDYTNLYMKCQKDYDNAMKSYNQVRYYIFAGLGLMLLIIGLLAIENMIQLTSLATGGILMVEGIVMNFQNKSIVFFSLIAILVIFGILAWRIITRKSSGEINEE